MSMSKGPAIYTRIISFRVREVTRNKFDELTEEERKTMTEYLRTYLENLLMKQ